MKKAMVFILTAILLFGVVACSKTAAPEQLQKLIEIDVSSLGNIRIAGLDSSEAYTVIYYSEIIELSGGEEDMPVPVQEHLAVFDLAKNQLVRTIEFQNEDNYWYTVRAHEDGFDLVNQQIGEVISYDYPLENPTKSTYDFSENWEKGEKVGTISISWFDCKDQYALSTSYGQTQALVFYDRPDEVYMLKNKNYYDYRQCLDHKILVIDSPADQAGSTVRVLDFDTLSEINALMIANDQDFNNIQCTNLNESTVTAATDTDNGSADKVYVWRYTVNPKNTAFEQDDCDRFAASAIEGKISDLCDRVYQTYGIVVECAPDVQFIRDSYNYTNDDPPILIYQKALDLEYDLSLLPKDVYREILCSDTAQPDAAFEEFRIYLVGAFPDANIDAYASNIGCDETDGKLIVYIVYSCSGLNQKTFFHELMHTFEYRIWTYESDYDTKWEALNPDGFAYTDDYVECFYDEDHEDWQKYFARDYGMKSDLEDHATCFEELCDGVLSGNLWWQDRPQLAAKEQYLVSVLQKSFPSLADWNVLEQAFPE